MRRRKALIKTNAYYLNKPLFNPRLLIKEAKKTFEQYGVEFDTMVGRGLSGAIAIPILARAMRKYFMIVRKTGDGTHSLQKTEGSLGRRWIFVDDLTDTGTTRNETYTVINDLININLSAKYIKDRPVFCGSYLYFGSRWEPSQEYKNEILDKRRLSMAIDPTLRMPYISL